jgi:hypothetical protein
MRRKGRRKSLGKCVGKWCANRMRKQQTAAKWETVEGTSSSSAFCRHHWEEAKTSFSSSGFLHHFSSQFFDVFLGRRPSELGVKMMNEWHILHQQYQLWEFLLIFSSASPLPIFHLIFIVPPLPLTVLPLIKDDHRPSLHSFVDAAHRHPPPTPFTFTFIGPVNLLLLRL